MNIEAKTNVGKVREMNQDFFKIHMFNDNSAVIIVCDGMGGASAGNVASEVATNTIFKTVSDKYNNDLNSDDIKTLLTSAVNCANLDVFDMAQNNTDYYGMGTTVVTILIKDGYAYIIHAGDSRAYLINDNKINQITTDHSIVQHLIESKMITPEEAKHHPKRNVITRALGVDEYLETDFNIIKLDKNDILLVCSDGLTNYVNDEDILNINQSNDPATAVVNLIELANNNGGGDNITVAIAEDF